MKRIYFIAIFLSLFVVTAGVSHAAYVYSFDVNGGASTAITPLSGTPSGAEFYNYSAPDGSPGFEQNHTAFFWLYNETDTGDMSLGVIFDKLNTDSYLAYAHFTLSGLPSGWGWTVQDDDGDIGNATDTTPTWNWSYHTDGGVIGGLEGSWTQI
jgi:hypothetical protein